MKFLIGLSLGISALCTGCIPDDRTECRFPLDISFSYTSHRAGNERLREDIKSLRLYLYDAQSGKLCETRSVEVAELDTLNTLQWRVPPGNYRLVAWGGDHAGRYALNIHDNHDDAVMNVVTNGDGEIEHKAEQLWHGITADITVDGEYHEPNICRLKRMTANVNITTTGLGKDDYSRVSAVLTGSNAAYTFAGTVHPANGISVWRPWHDVADSDPQARGLYKFTTMRARSGDDTRLTIRFHPEALRSQASRAADTESVVLYDGLLRDIIALHPGLDMDLDFDYDLWVEITDFTQRYVAFNIYINNWLVIRSNATLD